MSKSILSTIKEGKIRKNAKSKIQALLDAATSITYIKQESQVDDSYKSKHFDEDQAFFWQWYEQNYSDLYIWAYATNGKVTEIRFKDCPYWFANRIVLKFN